MEINFRFIKSEHYPDLINLYHLARAALPPLANKHSRMIWASTEWAKLHTYTSATGAYKDLSDILIGH